MARVESHGRETSEELEGVFDEAEPPTPKRSRTARKGLPASSAMRSTAKTGRRRPAASTAASSDDSPRSDAAQVPLHESSFLPGALRTLLWLLENCSTSGQGGKAPRPYSWHSPVMQ